MAIKQLAELTDSERAAVIGSVRAGDYNLFLGAGVSLDSRGGDGQLLPSSWDLQKVLAAANGLGEHTVLQRAFSALSAQQIEELISKRFAPCKAGASLLQFPKFLWKRTYTLNIDDAFENSYESGASLQTPEPIHFSDPFSDIRDPSRLPVVHLHGWARTPERGYVFSRSQYAKLMADSNSWMSILADTMPVEPFIVSGTKLDEVDLDFYLAKRTAESPRSDKGISFYVEPFPDAFTEKECSKYGLTLFVGTIAEFLSQLDRLAPERPAAHELISNDARALFPEGVSKEVVMSFANDFDTVPKAAAPASAANMRFAYGNPPDWSDLEGNWDVGRALTSRVLAQIDAMLSNRIAERVLVIEDDSGTGKSSVLRRCAFELSRSGVQTLLCSALSRLDPKLTAEALGHIPGPIVIIVDNLADQAQSVNNALELSDRTDIVFLCAERRYRRQHLSRTFDSQIIKSVSGLTLSMPEAAQLLGKYEQRGWVGSRTALKERPNFIRQLSKEPVAVACCHILKDLRPLDGIVDSMFTEGAESERSRYLVAALARTCFPGGVRYEVLAAASSYARMGAQFEPAHPLPLVFYDRLKEFVAPLNLTMAERILERAPKDQLFKTFKRLATAIAPWVNRDAIKRRSAEARLAGRLFDYEEVIKRFLGHDAEQFYSDVKSAWQWNSRYWEQIALFNISRYRATGDYQFLDKSIQHARHAVAVEKHAFTLTTLARMLMEQMRDKRYDINVAFSEAVDLLEEAISNEYRRGRASVHAYVNLFRGATEYIELGGELTDDHYDRISKKIRDAKEYFPRDRELRDIRRRLEDLI